MDGLSSIIKAYDVRGVVPDQWDEGVARRIGAAFAELVWQESRATAVVTAHDMRDSSVPLSRAFAEGVLSRGVDVVEAGLGSTDLLYFASGSLGVPGAMFTASHNPAQYNGIKLCRAGATPVGQDSGLATLREWAERDSYDRAPGRTASIEQRDLLAEYAAHLRSLVDLSTIRPLRVVVDAAGQDALGEGPRQGHRGVAHVVGGDHGGGAAVGADELGEGRADRSADVLVPLVGDDATDVVGLDDRGQIGQATHLRLGPAVTSGATTRA